MEFAEIFNSYILPVLITGFTGFITWLGAELKKKYIEKCNNETIKEVISMAVNYAEQKFNDLKGEEKYNKAVEKATNVLNNKGINISEDEIEMLIESTVLSLTNVVDENK